MSKRFDFKNGQIRAACEQGSTFISGLYLKDQQTNSIIDLTGCTFEMKVRSLPSSSTVILTISTASGNGFIDTALGKIYWSVPAATTAAITAGDYYYDLELSYPSGRVSRLIEGQFQVTGECTR